MCTCIGRGKGVHALLYKVCPYGYLHYVPPVLPSQLYLLFYLYFMINVVMAYDFNFFLFYFQILIN